MMPFVMLPHRCPKCWGLGLRYRYNRPGGSFTIIMARRCPRCCQQLGPKE